MSNDKINRKNSIMTKPKDTAKNAFQKNVSIALLSQNAFQKIFKNCSLKKCISKLL